MSNLAPFDNYLYIKKRNLMKKTVTERKRNCKNVVIQIVGMSLLIKCFNSVVTVLGIKCPDFIMVYKEDSVHHPLLIDIVDKADGQMKKKLFGKHMMILGCW